MIADATDGSWTRLVAGLAVTAVVSELCYRFIETPVRRGALGRWWRDWVAHRSVSPRAVALGAGAILLLVSLSVFFGNVQQFDAAEGGTQVTFEMPANPATQTTAGNDAAGPAPEPVGTIAPDPTTGPSSDGSMASEPAPVSLTPAVEPPTTTTVAPPPELPIDLAIVGDSQAHSLAINLPDGIESTFAVTDGSLDGCSVYDTGVLSAGDFSYDFGICAGWQQRWTGVATDADVVLVVLGAWDVFDLELDGQRLAFGTQQWDAAFSEHVQQGIDAVVGGGAKAAILEVPCMRPIDVEGAGVPALPERGDDQRVGHVNEVLRGVVAHNADTTAFVEGPHQWCDGSPESDDTAYRWDGVHVYIPGANLICTTIGPELLELV